MRWWSIGAVALVAVPLLLGASGRPSGSGAANVAPVRGLAAAAGLPPEWGDFFALVAWRESKGSASAENTNPGEAAAAGAAYERNAERYAGCGWPVSEYTWGSGGLFGILPANGLAQLGPELRCLSPRAVFDPAAALAMAVGFARGLMRWSRFKASPTWLNLRLMWGSPSSGGKASSLAKARAAFAPDASAVGLPARWLEQRPPALPLTGAQVLAALGGGS